MTAYGPPSGPPGSPPAGGGYGPPPSYGSGGPGGAGVPGAAGAPRSSGFDAKSVNPLDWAILGAGLLALIFSFFAFYSYDPKGVASKECSSSASSLSSVEKSLCGGDSASAWHGFFGWFGVLLLVVAALAVAMALFAPQVSLPVPARLLGAGLAALGVLMIIVSLFVIPDWPPIADLGVSSSAYDKVIDNGVGFSWYIVLLLGLVITALSVMRHQQTGGSLPGRGASASGAGPSTEYGQPSGYARGQEPGYGTPGQQPGYGTPGQQPGYGTPAQQPGGYAAPQPGQGSVPPPPQQTPPQQTPPQQTPPQQTPPQQTPPQQTPPPQGPPPGYQPPPGYTPPPPPQH
jgi:hypothetical protein